MAQSPDGTVRARQQAFREAEILRTGSQLLCRQGCAAFTMDEVARRLGISKATLYAHFRSRTQLIGAALKEAAEQVANGFAERRDHSLEALVRFLIERSLHVGADHSEPLPVPCCLREVECPYAGWAPVEELLERVDGPSADGDGLSVAQVVRVLSAVIAARVRAEGRTSTSADVDVVARYLDLRR